ncbi:MAG TPA: BTAD domain-containing putative transcriptional regulator, partial [Chthonomonadaceae bacterium]|nr:BTAD domain-containing putative transcriptional regulator [Chthonomonadaceae bacterium]
MDTPWRIELFGRLCARHGAHSLTRFRTQKTGVLLAYLAYYSGQPHRREALIEMLWPEDIPEAGRNSFRVAINALRRALELPDHPEPLLADRTYVQLNPALFTTDVAEFSAALQAENQSEEDAEKIKSLSFAVELYHSGLLPDYEEAWVEAERQRLENAYLGALRKLTRLLAQARDFDRAIDYAWRAIRIDPLREDSHRSLMRLYIGIGRPTAALQQYRELEHVLKTELGTAPSAATRELAKQILAARTPAPIETPTAPRASEPSAPPSPAPSEGPSPNTPVSPLTRFFGREEESALLLEMLRNPQIRLVTLLGPGGTGKTRLALEVARRLRPAFPAGV